ncbi:AcrR family transcriptional regulator [Catenuloplanes nepalensis]|uniref:AcrR family transcriptional regulator n=1 Tax=Catenuloplanes nepalensis TaxID=587533 RepID=A0ABT9MS77_9ACTN|nr:TetR/AcrR family transcriptional regulator [Catenuloplanes nepalensis]MDP9794294.1 AcrR family transcriptional regulator [Catenuloplanes nepalensis]
MTVRTRLTAAERGEQLIAAAVTAFASGGYGGTTTDQIARLAGVTQPYVIRLFGSKQRLFIAVMDHVCDRIEATFRQAAAHGTGIAAHENTTLLGEPATHGTIAAHATTAAQAEPAPHRTSATRANTAPHGKPGARETSAAHGAIAAHGKSAVGETNAAAGGADTPARRADTATLGGAYIELLAERDLLAVLLHGFSASADPEIGDAVRAGFGRIYDTVRELTGGSAEDLHAFMAKGMLCTVLSAMQLAGPGAVPAPPWAAELMAGFRPQ